MAKKDNKYLILIILISIVLIILMLLKFKNLQTFEDVIFLKMFGKKNHTTNINDESISLLEYDNYINENLESDDKQQYKFNVKYENLDLQEINLAKTINKKTLVNEKIAPGVRGEFDIIIESNIDTNYYVNFESMNSKPKNLTFNVKQGKNKYENVEELGKELTGIIQKNTTKTLTIQWQWEYENTLIQDIQDTKDGKTIEEYNFRIIVLGKQIA